MPADTSPLTKASPLRLNPADIVKGFPMECENCNMIMIDDDLKWEE